MTRSGPNRLHGYLVVDKPAGWTSHDVVGKVRRLTGERKVGHAGTLDPAATGVLPVAVGSATRSLEFLAESSKSYLAEITFGVATDSFDGDGAVLSVQTVEHVTQERIETALQSFAGAQMQLPPMHSAVKVNGRRLYEAARRGEEVAREPRSVHLHEIALVEWQSPVATVCIDCSKGTYIRSIAQDLGEALGCGAYLSNLVRIRSGPFSLADAWTIPQLEALDLVNLWPELSVHPDAGAVTLDAVVIGDEWEAAWDHGQELPVDSESGAWLRVYNERGDWLGVGLVDGEAGVLRPHKVVRDAA
jgi:tRNA pseudouridine55 synthase